MKKDDFYPRNLGDLLKWLELQKAQWLLHYAKFGVDKTRAEAIVADIQQQIDAINKVVKMQRDVAAEEDTRDKSLRTFKTGYRSQIRQFKNTAGIDQSLFSSFEWDGAEVGKPDPDSTRPRLTGTHQSPTMNSIEFVRGPFDGVDGEVSADGVTWARDEFDTRSPYDDKRPNRQPGVPEWRYYRFRYRLNGEPFGQYSEIVRLLTSIS